MNISKLYIPAFALLIAGSVYVGHVSGEKKEEAKAKHVEKVYTEDEIIDRNPEEVTPAASDDFLIPYDSEMVNGWGFSEEAWNNFVPLQERLYEAQGTDSQRFRDAEYVSLLMEYWAAYDVLEAEQLTKAFDGWTDTRVKVSEYRNFTNGMEGLYSKLNESNVNEIAKEAYNLVDEYEVVVQRTHSEYSSGIIVEENQKVKNGENADFERIKNSIESLKNVL